MLLDDEKVVRQTFDLRSDHPILAEIRVGPKIELNDLINRHEIKAELPGELAANVDIQCCNQKKHTGFQAFFKDVGKGLGSPND